MSIWKRRIVFVLLVFTCCFCIYGFYSVRRVSSWELISTSVEDVSSTREWQELLSKYLVMRNNIINDILDGRYYSCKKYMSMLKAFEHSPLVDGDIKTFEYMYKHPREFLNRTKSIKVEYSDIRKLTRDEVTMAAKICYDENAYIRRYDYEVIFTNVDGKWKLSRFSYLK